MSVLEHLRSMLDQKQLSALELTQYFLETIQRDNPALRALLYTAEETALEQAKLADRSLAAGEPLSPLTGIPLVLKDNISTRGLPTTCGSRMLEGYRPVYDAAVWEALGKQGAVLLGKGNLDEFAMGSSTETSWFGPSRNPWNPTLSPGGSSGGPAAAVADGLAVCALGSDTGGSIRQPAAFCGITGLKPTYGAVSRWGLIAYASSLDQIGPMALCAKDAALLLDAITGPDFRDDTYRGLAPVSSSLEEPIRGQKAAIPREMLEGASPAAIGAVEETVRRLETLGVSVEEISLPALQLAAPAYYIIACAEASSNLARYDGIRYGHRSQKPAASFQEAVGNSRREGFGPEVKRRILLGSFVLSSGYYDAYYLKALRTKALIKGAFDKAFSRFDVIVAPAAPTTAPRLGESLKDPLQMYLGDIYTISVNLAGLPGMTVPCGLDSQGLPIGLQLIGDCFQEKKIIRAAYAFEQSRKYQSPALARAQAGVSGVRGEAAFAAAGERSGEA